MEITLSTLREMFGNPQPPQSVWEKQFDYLDSELRKVARKPWEDISDSDLWYYLHDLAYQGLQPNLFAYLFPVCLHFWYRTLMRDESAGQGDADFQYSLHHGQILKKMLDEEGREKVYTVIHDGFLHRLDQEKALPPREEEPIFTWIYRFNSMGVLFPVIDRIWESWWRVDTRGRAICALIWASGFICGDDPDDNPLFWDMGRIGDYDRPYLRENDCFYIEDVPWLETDAHFLSNTVNADYIRRKMLEAAQTLESGHEHQMALQLAAMVEQQPEFIEPRKTWLLGILA